MIRMVVSIVGLMEVKLPRYRRVHSITCMIALLGRLEGLRPSESAVVKADYHHEGA